jgi:two-component system, NarL family, sensor histidine kinase DesK
VTETAGTKSDRERSPARDRSADTIVSRLTDSRLGDPPRSVVGRMRMFIWLVFIAIPLVDAVSSHNDGPSKALTVLATIAFLVVFVSTAVRQDKPLPDRQALRSVGTLLAISVALTVLDRPGWGTLFIFTVVAIAMCIRSPFSFYGVLLCTALCVGSLLAADAAAGAIFGFATPTLGIGMLMLVVADLRTRNRELHEARAELARLAVADERARFARDLHDLLGHSLSVIALKAELAGRLLRERPSEAAGHVTEIEQVARGALTEVREAVSGYRRPTLDDEIAGAKMALSAAGIEAQIERPAVTFDPAIEAVLAWTVREGATNVIRHSGAGHCCVKVTAGLGEAGVEVIDDGLGRDDAAANGHGGNGLEGLGERVARLQGQIEAGAGAAGGYKLAVRVPVPAS